ncbi:UNKNOWN [Stylonychia lemnae]|uniref:Uncharacterized protein n=1 Tax=Stylonychia lemnae TaxID=5949 RepID=A0A078A5Q7_STYLE|nr:UNKNOWN [Stylonychia lemnae]|eukprot:CDW77580.1 UNKNOWN [Stylonychia lemnae]
MNADFMRLLQEQVNKKLQDYRPDQESQMSQESQDNKSSQGSISNSFFENQDECNSKANNCEVTNETFSYYDYDQYMPTEPQVKQPQIGGEFGQQEQRTQNITSNDERESFQSFFQTADIFKGKISSSLNQDDQSQNPDTILQHLMQRGSQLSKQSNKQESQEWDIGLIKFRQTIIGFLIGPCKDYEHQMLGKSKATGSVATTRKKEATQSLISTSFMKSRNDKKRKREVIEKLELIYQKIHSKLDNPFKTAKKVSSIDEVWRKMPPQQQSGYINAFVILRPILKKAVKQQDKVQRAISMLIKSGIFSKKNIQQGANQVDGIPYISHQDAIKLLEMEVSLANMNDKINSVFLRTKENLDVYQQRVQKILDLTRRNSSGILDKQQIPGANAQSITLGLTFSPLTVGSTSSMTYTVTPSSFSFATGDELLLTFPTSMVGSLITTATCQSGASSQYTITCSYTTNTIRVAITIVTTSPSQFRMTISNGYQNPTSAQKISSIKADIYRSSSVYATRTSGSVSFTAAVMTTASLESSSKIVSFTPKNPLPSTGYLIFSLPFYTSTSDHMITTTSPTCASVTGMSSSITCTYDTNSRFLTVKNPVSSSTSGSSLTFSIYPFKNPYNAKKKSSFKITTLDKDNYEIDSVSSLTLQVTDFATFNSVEIYRYDGVMTVEETSILNFVLSLSFPVDASCRLRIDFPTDQPLTSDLVNIFGDESIIKTEGSTSITNSAPTYFTYDGCPNFISTTQSQGMYVYLESVLNAGKVKDTSTFTIKLYALDSGVEYNIAEITAGLIITKDMLSTGSIASFKLTAATTTVSATSLYTLEIQPSHSIPASSKIKVKFPTSISLQNIICTVSTVTTPISTGSSCLVSSNVLTLTNPFGSSTFTKGGSAFSFMFSNGGTNPDSVRDAGTFTVSTYYTDSGIDYGIDSSDFTNVFTPTAAVLTAVVTPASLVAYNSPTDYAFAITPVQTIPIGGKIKVVFPTVITGTSITTCTLSISGSSPTCTVSSTSPLTVSITGGFTTAYTAKTTPFTLTLGNLRNPRTTAVTSSFTITTTDSSDNKIAEASTGITVQMTQVPDITSFAVAQASGVNGAATDYTFTVTSPIPQLSTDKITFTFPTEITVPGSITCATVSNVGAISCAVSGSTVTATFTFSGGTLAASTAFSFKVSSITNPPSTAPTSAFTAVEMRDTSDGKLAGFSGTVLVTDTTPATITTKSLDQAIYTLSTATTYTITYTTMNAMAAGGAFKVTYPSTVSSDGSITTCNVIYSSVTYSMSGCTVDTTNKIISIPTGFTQAVAKGDSIKVQFGPITNPSTNKPTTSSFSIQSYTSSTFVYTFDLATTDLLPNFDCTYPCNTCNTGQKTQCLTCIPFATDPAFPYYYSTGLSCLVICPDGTYNDNYICKACPTECKTCSSATVCITCDTTGNYPYFSSNWCVSLCPTGQCSQNFICTSTCTASQFTSITIVPSPTAINSVGTTLTITAQLDTSGSSSRTTYKTGDILYFNIPSPGSFTAATGTSYCTASAVTVLTTTVLSVSSCSINSNSFQLKVGTISGSPSKLVMTVQKFNNPASSCDITSVAAQLLDSTGNTQAQYSTGKVTGFTGGTITTALLSSSSQIVGSSGNTLTVSFAVVNALTAGGTIKLIFPYWNPSSSTKLHMISSPTCTGVEFLSGSLTCTYDTATLTLSITTTSAAPTATVISFTVTGFRNPYNGIAKSGFTLSTYDSTSCVVESITTLTIQTNTMATLTSGAISRVDAISTVEELSTMKMTFVLDLPTDISCKLVIGFPADQPVTSALASFASGTNILSTVASTTTATKDTAAQTATITGCSAYAESGLTSAVNLVQLFNTPYKKTTSTFSLQLYALVGSTSYNIAELTTGITVADTILATGTVTGFVLTPTSTVINEQTTYKLTFKPSHSIPTNSKIKITFPSSMVMTDASCTLSSVTLASLNPSACEMSSNVLTLTNPFGSSTFTKGGSAFSFMFSSGGKNPSIIADAGTFIVQTYATILSVDYPIDESSFTNVFTPTATLLKATLTTISSYVTNAQPSSYTFTITPKSDVASGSQLKFIFPTQIQLTDSGTSVTPITTTISGTTRTLSGCTTTSVSGLVNVICSDPFTSAFNGGGTGSFTITLGGMKNPRSLAVTDSFEIFLKDSSGGDLEVIQTGITATMLTQSDMVLFKAVPDSFVNGASATYEFTIQSSQALSNGDYISFLLPTEITLPTGTLTCTAVTNIITVTCSKISSSKGIKAAFTFSGGQLVSGNQIVFKAGLLSNPPNTQESTEFDSIQLYDKTNSALETYNDPVTITMTTPATVTTKSLAQGVSSSSVATTYTITYSNVNKMAANSAFEITYPSTVTVPSSLTTCYIMYNNIKYTMTCAVDSANKKIKVSDTFSSAVASAGQSIKIYLGPITNPADSQNTQTFQLMSYTDNTFTYKIDQITGGLIPSFACTLPCKTCSATDLTYCLSCFIDVSSIIEKYFYSNKCLTVCPSGYYAGDYQICTKCDDRCLTCNQAGKCLTCNNTGSYPNFHGVDSMCYGTCPNGYFANSTFYCAACDSNCKTCNVNETNCTSCYASGQYPFLADNKCINTCQNGQVSINYTCTNCSTQCVSCQSTPTQCSSCSVGYLYGTKCVTDCPSPYVQRGTKCVGCDPNCGQCSKTDVNYCDKCASGYILYDQVCYTKCPDGYQPTSNNITCEKIVNITNVTITFNKTDDTASPILMYFPYASTQTVLGGVVGAAVLKSSASLVSTNLIAFWGPLEFMSFGTQVYLAYDKLNSSTSAVSNSTIQIQQVNSRRNLQEDYQLQTPQTNIWPLVFYGTAFAFIVKFIMNIIFGFLFFLIIFHDPGFREYYEQYKWTPKIIFVIGVLFSFKIYRLFYSRLFGSLRFYVQFENPERIHSIFNILTVLNIVFSCLPVLAIDIYGLLKYGWGGQFYIIVIETLAITSLQIGFQTYEYYKVEKVIDPSKQLVYNFLPEDFQRAEERIMRMVEERFQRLMDQRRQEEEDKQRLLKKDQDDTSIFDPFPDNVYADEGFLPKKKLKPDQIKTKVIQYGQDAQTGQDYDSDFEKRFRAQTPDIEKANQRNEQRFEVKPNPDNEDESLTNAQQRKNKGREKKRGRKDKFHNDIEKDNQKFLQEEEKSSLSPVSPKKLIELRKSIIIEEEEEKLQSIQEESHYTENPIKSTAMDQKLLESQIIEDEEHQETEIFEEENAIDGPNQMFDQTRKPDASLLERESPMDRDSSRLMESPKPQQNQKLLESPKAKTSPRIDQQQLLEQQNIQKQQELDKLEEDIDYMNPKFKSTLQMQKEVEMLIKPEQEDEEQKKKDNEKDKKKQQKKKEQVEEEEDELYLDNNIPSEMGEPDSDDDNEVRIKNITHPEKKRFNVNDILGQFDQDDKGNPVILQDSDGEYVDKDGSRVNQKGYLIDEKTGDVVEKEGGKKIFDFKDLDERGELPAPYNLERFNFNIHDVRGYFDRDKDGNEIMWNRKDGDGNPIDKLGRRINKYGYLIDKDGNLVDKRGRIKLNSKIMDKNGGEIPMIFNYKGKKFDIRECMGALDKDRQGNIIIRRDRDNKMVDKKGRRVNNKGYLVDNQDNVISEDGLMMFEKFLLSKDNEIPKLFPFLKFNIDDIKGEFEMDPLGNPMLHKSKLGFVDDKGNKVNEKGYLLDDNGNVRNKKGFCVFNRFMLEDDGEIPNIFRTGLIRKDTQDSLAKLMDEIDDLEMIQDLDVNDPRRRKTLTQQTLGEHKRLQDKIDQIVEEDNDDEIMREIEQLAGDQPFSDGGNTSVDSLMEDTPSNYNAANQRFNEVEKIKNKAKKNIKKQQQVPEEVELESQYSYLPDKKLKAKKKKKKKKNKDADIDRDLLMAKAYGKITQQQYEKLLEMKKMKEKQNSQLNLMLGNPKVMPQMSQMPQNMNRDASNTKMAGVPSKRSPLNDGDMQSEFGGNQSVRDGLSIKAFKPSVKRVGGGFAPPQKDAKTVRERDDIQNKSTMNRFTGAQKNNLMSGTIENNNNDTASNNSNRRYMPTERDRKLSHIANSVSGFYKEGNHNQSEHSGTIESSQAKNLVQRRRTKQDDGTNFIDQDQFKATAKGGFELDQYQYSDNDNQSHISGRTNQSRFKSKNNPRLKGLEAVYLQRLEPSVKARQGGPTTSRKDDKAKFRVMHHKYHDDPEWHVDPDRDRDDLDSVISNNYNQMLELEFQGADAMKKKKRKDNSKSRQNLAGQGSMNDSQDGFNAPNIFHGNFNQYKEKKFKSTLPSVDFAKT